MTFPLRTSSSALTESHEPYSAAPSVNITPLLLRKMEKILLATSDASLVSHINRYQAALASRRLKLIASTLRQMPHPAPSPRLLTAMQSLCLLVRQCAFDTAEEDPEVLRKVGYGPDDDPLGLAQCWPVLLCQHFTSRLLFRAAYRRLWTAWRMYSPMELEHEDAVAEAKDRAVDADAMLRLLFAAQDIQEVEAQLSSSTVEQHRHDMLAYYQRREMSSWRIFYQLLEPLPDTARGRKLSSFFSASVASAPGNRSHTPPEAGYGEEEGEEAYRFRVLPNVYVYHSVPVVVKALCAAPEPATGCTRDDCDAETEAAAMAYAADFLQDVACRCMWCHPHVVHCLGGYTEKFVPSATEETQGNTPSQAPAVSTSPVDDHHTATAAAAAAHPPAHETGLPWLQHAAALSGTPVMALGYITEVQTSAELDAPSLTLGDMLFPSPANAQTAAATRHYFTLSDALDICAQLADALQYILEDSGDVPPAVRTSWLTLDPSNVFVVRSVGPADGAPTAEPQHLPPRGRDGSRVDGRASVLARHARSSSSAAFSDSFSSPETSNNTSTPAAVPGGSGSISQREQHAALDLAGHERAPLLHPTSLLTVHVDPAPGSFSAAAPFGGRSPLMVHHASAAPLPSPSPPPPPLRGEQRFVVRYAPPTDWTTRKVGSRWRPHPRATAPASYVIAQMFLALTTRQVPYAAYKSDSDVQRRVFGQAATSADTRSGVQVKLGSGGQGYRLPSSLPPSIAQWCRQALSLDRSQPPMELESLRDALTTIQASLTAVTTPSAVRADVANAAPSRSISSREMSSRTDSGFA